MYLKASISFCFLLWSLSSAVPILPTTKSRSLLQQKTRFSIGSEASSTTGTSSSAGASASLRLTGPGKVTVQVKAKGVGVGRAKRRLVVAIKRAIAKVKRGKDAEDIAEFEASAFGRAAAKAVSKARVRISSNTKGATACGSASANATADANAFAGVLVDVLTKASDKINFADTSVAVEAIVSVTVSAFSSAQAKACGEGEFEVDTFTSVLSTTVGVPYSKVIAAALTAVASKTTSAEIVVEAKNDVLQVSTIEGDTGTDVTGEVIGKTSGTGGTDIIIP